MPKTTTLYRCQQCDFTQPRWSGQCPNCKAWNSMVEEVQVKSPAKKGTTWAGAGSKRAIRLSDVKKEDQHIQRLTTGSPEFDRVLGGGMVPGSVVLIAGEPGVGKSTLLTQLAINVKDNILYACGEESESQVGLRVNRLGGTNLDSLYLFSETNVDAIIMEAQTLKPSLLIVDSIQTLHTDDLEGMAGSVGQVRESALRLTELAKQNHITTFIVGHVTKEGTIAGPKVLEHMVDVVLNLWGDEDRQWRFLKTQKNRFGATDEVGVFDMDETGMRDVKNPSGVFLEEIQSGVPGSAIVALMEGTRPILVEVQALVVESQLAMPRRVVNGIPLSKLQVIAAVLQKRCGLGLGTRDIFINVAGGLKIDEPAADLGIALAIASSFANQPLPKGTVSVGEVGLLGELRKVGNLKRRIDEANKMGFSNIISINEYKTIRDVVKAVIPKKQ